MIFCIIKIILSTFLFSIKKFAKHMSGIYFIYWEFECVEKKKSFDKRFTYLCLVSNLVVDGFKISHVFYLTSSFKFVKLKTAGVKYLDNEVTNWSMRNVSASLSPFIWKFDELDHFQHHSLWKEHHSSLKLRLAMDFYAEHKPNRFDWTKI